MYVAVKGFPPAIKEHCMCLLHVHCRSACTLSLSPTQHCYHANHTTLPSKTDHSDFSSLLSSGCLIIDLYDRDSLFLLGTARLPLRVRMIINSY